MDGATFRQEIMSAFRRSGRWQRLHTHVRADLIDMMQEQKRRREHSQGHADTVNDAAATSALDRALNALILEHLMRGQLWYTASVLASEAQFPAGETALLGHARALRPGRDAAGRLPPAPSLAGQGDSCPAKLSDRSIDRILDGLSANDRIRIDLDRLRWLYYRQSDRSLLGALLLCQCSTQTDVPGQPGRSRPTTESRRISPKKRSPPTPARRGSSEPPTDTVTQVASAPNSVQSGDDIESRRSYSPFTPPPASSISATTQTSPAPASPPPELARLRTRLHNAESELQRLRDVAGQVQRLQSLVEEQQRELDGWRQRRKSVSRDADTDADAATHLPAPTTSRLPPAAQHNHEGDVKTFVQQMRSTVDRLYQGGLGIENELSKL